MSSHSSSPCEPFVLGRTSNRESFSPSGFLLGEKVPKADEGAFHEDVIRAPSSALPPASVNRAYLVKCPPHPASPPFDSLRSLRAGPSPPARNRGVRRALDEGSGKALEGTIQVRVWEMRAGALLLSALLLAACAHPEQAPPRVTVDAPVVAAQRTSLPAFHSVAGTVRSQTASTLSANVVGTVVRVLVAEGDRVRAGEVVVEIDARAQRAQADRARAGGEEVERAIDAATANAKLAESTYQRYAALRERGSASPQELDEVRTRNTAARAELARLVARRGEARAESAQAAAVLGYNSVRAPIDGIVTGRFADPGAQAAPGVPLIAIEDERAARVDANVPENVAVRAGDRAVVVAGNDRFTAHVTRVQPSVDSSARSALVKLALDRPLRSGTYVNVLFPVGERSAVTVPSSSVVRRGELTSVFVVGADHVARMRLITLGAIDADRTEILSGLDAGESIVFAPARVREGVIVRSGA